MPVPTVPTLVPNSAIAVVLFPIASALVFTWVSTFFILPQIEPSWEIYSPLSGTPIFVPLMDVTPVTAPALKVTPSTLVPVASCVILVVFAFNLPIHVLFISVRSMESLISASVVVTPAPLLISPVTFSASVSTLFMPFKDLPSVESPTVLPFKVVILSLFVATSPVVVRASSFASTSDLV